MTRVALTGGTGFVGQTLVPMLLASGHDVRVLVRPASIRQPVPNGIEVVRGDVRSLQNVEKLVEGCDVLVHMAGTFNQDEDVEEIVERGARNVLTAAAESGITRVVHLSCLGAEASAHSLMLRAKWKSEVLMRTSTVPTVILRPSLVVGASDAVIKPLAKLLRVSPFLPLPATGVHRVQPIDVGDLATCICTAVTSESLLGEEVSVGGDVFLTHSELADLVGEELHLSKRKVFVPERMLPVLSRRGPQALQTVFNPARIALFRTGVVASTGIVSRTFGFEPKSIPKQIGVYLAGL